MFECRAVWTDLIFIFELSSLCALGNLSRGCSVFCRRVVKMYCARISRSHEQLNNKKRKWKADGTHQECLDVFPQTQWEWPCLCTEVEAELLKWHGGQRDKRSAFRLPAAFLQSCDAAGFLFWHFAWCVGHLFRRAITTPNVSQPSALACTSHLHTAFNCPLLWRLSSTHSYALSFYYFSWTSNWDQF